MPGKIRHLQVFFLNDALDQFHWVNHVSIVTVLIFWKRSFRLAFPKCAEMLGNTELLSEKASIDVFYKGGEKVRVFGQSISLPGTGDSFAKKNPFWCW